MTAVPGRSRTIVAAVAACAVGVVLLRLVTHDNDPSSFVIAADDLVDPAAAPSSLTVSRGSGSYDGVLYFRLGLDPLTDVATDRGITLDAPSYRQQRIGYPVLAWAASGGGRAGALPWALIAVNVAALAVLAAAGVSLARRIGRHPAWGAAIALAPGTAVALNRDTAEVVAAAALLWTIVLLRRERWVPAAATLTIAVLTRETTMVLCAGLAVAALAPLAGRGRSRRLEWRRAAVAAVAALTFLGWQLWVRARWGGRLPALSTEAAGAPLVGVVDTLEGGLGANTVESVFDVAGMAATLAFAVVCVVALHMGRRAAGVRVHEAVALLLAAAVTFSMAETQWTSHLGYARATVELFVLGTATLLTLRRRWADGIVIGSLAAWAAVAVADSALL